jgi:hypothetical protein
VLEIARDHLSADLLPGKTSAAYTQPGASVTLAASTSTEEDSMPDPEKPLQTIYYDGDQIPVYELDWGDEDNDPYAVRIDTVGGYRIWRDTDTREIFATPIPPA